VIDKAEGLLYAYQSFKQLEERAKSIGQPMRQVRLRGGRWAYQIGPEEWGIYVRPDSAERQSARYLITNPSRFKTFDDYRNTLIAILSRNDFECIKLMRLDFAVDLNLSFEEVRKRVRIRFKQYGHSFHVQGGTQTGITVGKRPEEICIYDKAREQKLEGEDRTRIEVRLWRQKVPVDYLHELPSIAGLDRNGDPFRPFEKVQVDDFELKHHREFSSRPDLIRVTRLTTLISYVGYQHARRFLNKGGKFNSMYGRFITVNEPVFDLHDTLLSNLREYFGPQPRRRL
jgi:hypothetical protein